MPGDRSIHSKEPVKCTQGRTSDLALSSRLFLLPKSNDLICPIVFFSSSILNFILEFHLCSPGGKK